MTEVPLSDYSLVGKESTLAAEKGLVDAHWYTTPVPKDQMRKLLQRKDGPAIRDTLLWFALLIGFGVLGFLLWGTWWAILPFAAYGVLYGSSSDSRWHESSHGTAFKTDWMNNALYEIASFMIFRESIPWRWSHARHHSDTIIVGRDPEISVPRPPNFLKILLGFIGIKSTLREVRKMLLHCTGNMTAEEKTYVPEGEYPKVFFRARIYILIYATLIGLALYTHSILPLVYIGLPAIYGRWLGVIYAITQHAGLAENVLDHRLNSRTVYMNLMNRYLYWNMNYHVEHHMFPLVPYHQLPRLHEVVKHDTPPPYNGLRAAYREILPALLRQVKEPGYYVERELPATAGRPNEERIENITTSLSDATEGWIDVGNAEILNKEDVLRFDHGEKTYAIYRTKDDCFYATDGICTHGKTHLADGMVLGHLIECPKHNGRFDIRDGSAQRPPVCVGIRTYDVQVTEGRLTLHLSSGGEVESRQWSKEERVAAARCSARNKGLPQPSS